MYNYVLVLSFMEPHMLIHAMYNVYRRLTSVHVFQLC